MSNEPIVTLHPDDRHEPTRWASADDGDPLVVLRRIPTGWIALFDRQPVAQAATAEQLTARLYGEHGLMAILDANGIAA